MSVGKLMTSSMIEVTVAQKSSLPSLAFFSVVAVTDP